MKWWPRFSAFQLGLLITLGMASLYIDIGQTGLAHYLETKALDLRFRWRGVQSPGSQVVMVVIDDASITKLGRWPWSRHRFAALVRRLKAAGASVIAFDLLFTEPEESPVHDVLQDVQAAFEALPLSRDDADVDSFYQTLAALAQEADPDRDFAHALQEAGNVVLAYAFRLTADAHRNNGESQPPPDYLRHSAYRTLQNETSEATARVPRALEVFPPIPTLALPARSLGHVNVGLDTDGTLRYDYPVVAYEHLYYPSLPVQAVRLYLGLAPEEVKVQFGRGLQLGPHLMIANEAMHFLVNYYDSQSRFPIYSMADVLQGRVPEAMLHGKIVLVGSMAVGIGDMYVTPFSSEFHGLEKQATVIANILQGQFLQRHGSTLLLDLICLVLVGLLVGWVGPKLPLLPSWLYAIGLGGLYVGLNHLTFAHLGLWVNLVFPVATVVLTQIACTIHRSLTEERQKRRLRQAFQYYLHPSVVEHVTQHPELLTLGGEVRELTVLFSDIQGFTSISEHLTPEALVQLLNEYLSAMTRLVLEENGLLDKYIGDALMAVYGAPLSLPDHAYRACHTALRMLEQLQSLQPDWRARGFPEIAIRIGINTGPMVVGNMGSDLRFTYTAMGDAVNLGSRLEGVNKIYGTCIIMSEATWEQVKDRIAARELDAVRVEGKNAPVRIFEVVGVLPLPAAQQRLMQHFAQGLQAYRAQQWDRAIHCFCQSLAQKSDDTPSRLYLQRCQTFKRLPPPADWDGIYVMPTK
jgi:adenylate cyclase